MVFVCYVTLQDHVIKESCDFMAVPHVNSPSCQFWWPRHCGSGYMNILANTVILPQMLDINIGDCIFLHSSVITIFSKAHDLSCAIRVYSNNLKNISYGKFLVYLMK